MIRLELHAQLAAEAQAPGLALDQYVEKIVTTRPREENATKSPALAVAAIRKGRKGIRLDGLRIMDHINEGRKF